MFNKVCELYEYFYQKTAMSPTFTFIPKDSDSKMINNFLNKLPSGAGEEWLFDFLTYQFSRYYSQNTRFGTGIVQLGWVIGQKALDSWSNRTEEQLYYTQKYKVDFGIRKETEPTTTISKQWREREKKRFHNTDRGFYHCKEMEIMRSSDKYCLTCKNKKVCDE